VERLANTLLEEVYKRTFLRLLIFWIFGTLLQVFFPVHVYAFALIAVVALTVLFSAFSDKRNRYHPVYSARWVWGLLFAFMVIFLSIQITEQAINYVHDIRNTPFLIRLARQIQSSMVEKIGLMDIPDAHKSVLASLSVNYKATMDWATRSQFSVAGVAHVLAVSGFHVAVVYWCIRKALFFLPEKIVFWKALKYCIIILYVWGYALISGLGSPSVRAALMITVFLIGKILRRSPDKYNSLFAAAFIMLVYNPLDILSISFQLSFTAVFFIMYLQPKLEDLISVKNPLISVPWDIITCSIAAQTGVMFLCCYYFGYISTLFIFANLFVCFMAEILIPCTLLWLLLPLSTPYLSDILQYIIATTTRWMMWIVDGFSSIPGAAFKIRIDIFTLLASYLWLALTLLWLRFQRYSMLMWSLITLLIIIVWHIVMQ
jgi:competence protein ComEC